MRSALFLSVTLFAPALAGCNCASVPPPPSRLPDAASALARMHATYACANAIKATDAKMDYAGDRGRVRGDMSLYVARPERIRMDIFAPPPLSTAIDTLTSDGKRFALRDLRENKFYFGAATACNIARLTNVPVPGNVLVDLLRGQAPVLKHEPAAARIEWSGDGYYVVSIPSTHDASEEIHMKPRPDDWAKPWAEQRMQVVDVRVEQEGFVLYHAELDEHAVAPMDTPIAGMPGSPGVPLSGPPCDAEVPRKIRVEVPYQDEEVRFRYTNVNWNPPLEESTFTQPIPRGQGLQAIEVSCSDQR